MGQFKLVLYLSKISLLITMLFPHAVVVLPLDWSQIPSPMWKSAFFDILNYLVLLTHSSDIFCQSLCSAGFVHFVECELEKLGKAASNVVSLYI